MAVMFTYGCSGYPLSDTRFLLYIDGSPVAQCMQDVSLFTYLERRVYLMIVNDSECKGCTISLEAWTQALRRAQDKWSVYVLGPHSKRSVWQCCPHLVRSGNTSVCVYFIHISPKGRV